MLNLLNLIRGVEKMIFSIGMRLVYLLGSGWLLTVSLLVELLQDLSVVSEAEIVVKLMLSVPFHHLMI